MPYLIWLGVAVVFGMSGPFGSYVAMPLGLRLVFWSSMGLVAVAVGVSIRAFVRGTLNLEDFRRGAVLTAFLVALVLTLPMQVMIDVLFGRYLTHMPTLAEFAMFFFCTSLAIGAFRHAIVAPGAVATLTEAPAEDAAGEDPPMARLMERLPDDVRGGDLVSISGRDHYVDVVTTQGKASLLMRFSDAMAEVQEIEGDQLHRSHWVAWAYVSGTEKTKGRLAVVLSCGRRVPVSRNHRDKLEARGLI